MAYVTMIYQGNAKLNHKEVLGHTHPVAEMKKAVLSVGDAGALDTAVKSAR